MYHQNEYTEESSETIDKEFVLNKVSFRFGFLKY
jgi:hypothetical protein